MEYIYNDGGRSNYFNGKNVGVCVIRAIAIASQKDYKEVYDYARKIMGGSPIHGIPKKKSRMIAGRFGGVWHPVMKIGSGCTVHLKEDELPKGRIVCSVSKHYVAVIDGVINDTFDPSRGGERCVYGYYVFSDENGNI